MNNMSKYIDADKLEKNGWNIHRIRQASSTEMVYEAKKPTDFPAADVQEVRHGRWKNEIDTGTEMMACSVCGARVVKQPYISAVGRKGYAYCPYCGAKMDEEKSK